MSRIYHQARPDPLKNSGEENQSTSPSSLLSQDLKSPGILSEKRASSSSLSRSNSKEGKESVLSDHLYITVEEAQAGAISNSDNQYITVEEAKTVEKVYGKEWKDMNKIFVEAEQAAKMMGEVEQSFSSPEFNPSIGVYETWGKNPEGSAEFNPSVGVYEALGESSEGSSEFNPYIGLYETWSEVKNKGIPETTNQIVNLKSVLLRIARQIDAGMRNEPSTAKIEEKNIKSKMKEMGRAILEKIKPFKEKMKIFTKIAKKIAQLIWKFKFRGHFQNLKKAKQAADRFSEPLNKLIESLEKKMNIKGLSGKLDNLNRRLSLVVQMGDAADQFFQGMQ